MMKRKIICVSLCIIMIMLSLPSAFVSAAVADKNAVASMHLSNLGVLEPSFWQEENEFITREEFAFLVYAISGETASYDAVVFSDVSIDSKYYNAIEFCVHHGLINGYDDGTFRPSQPISVIEAAKVFTIFAGYNSQAYYEGGYSFGYSSVARHIGLFDSVKVYDEKAFITRSALAQMTYNTLVCPYFAEYQYDHEGNIYFERTGETVAEHYLGLVYTEGVMQSNGLITVDDIAASDDTVIIAGKELACDNYEFMKYVGHTVECFYDKEDEIARSVVSDSQKTKTITVNATKITSVEKNIIRYEDGNEIKKLSISSDALYFLNGEPILSYDIESLIDMPNAEVYLIINDGANDYNLVFVNIYDEMVVGSRSANGVIVDLFDSLNSVTVDEEGSVPVRIVNEKGEVISYDAIAKNNIISVMEGSGFIYVRVSETQVSGALQAKADDYITVSGEDFIIAESCRSTIASLPLGTNVKVYVNSAGVMIKLVNNGGDSTQYGYLYKSDLETGISSKLMFKIFTVDGEMKIYQAADKVKIDDVTVEVKKLSSVPVQLQNLNCLIGFSADEDGIIKKIDLPSDSYGSGESTFYRAVENSTLRYHTTNGIIDGKHIIGSNTVIMQIPADSEFENEDDFMIFTKSALYTSNYTVDIYYYSALSEYCDVAIFHGASQKMVYDSYIAVLSSVIGTRDEDGADVYAVNYMSKNKMNTAYVPEDMIDDFNQMGKGDVFRFSVNSKGYFSDINWIYDFSEDATKNTVGDAWSDSARVVTKYVAKVGSGTLRLSDSMASYNDSSIYGQEIVPVTSPYITVVEDGGKTIREGTVADISEGSKIVMYQRSTTPRAIIVYNND